MATFVLLHGAGSDSWYWHLVAPRLQADGHDVVAVDMPCDDDSAGFTEYADAVVEAIGDRTDIVLVAQSLAGFVAPLVAARVPVEMIVLVAAMVPKPGESAGDWWANTDHRSEGDMHDPATMFLHDVPPDVAAESAHHVRRQSGRPLEDPWPLDGWPDVPTRVLLCRHDRLFSAEFQRRVTKQRLGITPDEMDGGHLPALSRPQDLADRLHAYHAGR